MGHSSITVTLDRYGGLFPSLDVAIADGLDEVLRDSLAASSRPEPPIVTRQRGDTASLPSWSCGFDSRHPLSR